MARDRLSPASLGLPPSFTKFRPGQLDAIFSAVSTPNRFTVLQAAPGSGKSMVYTAASKIIDGRALILTGTRGLQNQLIREFGACGAYPMYGASNFPCHALDRKLSSYGRKNSGCDVGPCRIGVYCDLRNDGCAYYDARREAREAPIVVTNYAYWLSLGRFSDPDALGEFDLLVLDEAHSVLDWISSFCTVTIDRKLVRDRLSRSRVPTHRQPIADWVSWAKGALPELRRKIEQLRVSLDGDANRKVAMRAMFELINIERDIGLLVRYDGWRSEDAACRISDGSVESDWVVELSTSGDKVQIRPVWVHGFVEDFLFRGIGKVIMASGTMPPNIKDYLGLGRPPHLVEMSRGFDPKRRPIIYVPTTSVDYKMVEGQKRMLVNRIDNLIKARPGLKGIIHTRSYERTRDLLSRSRHADRMITHGQGRNEISDAVARFKASSDGILVSPAVEEGYDFPYDGCRWQVIVKVPFTDSRDPVTKARSRTDKSLSLWMAVKAFIQAAGRGMRAQDDYCETFIFDDYWRSFVRYAPIPRWFKSACRECTVIPPYGG